MKLHEYFDKTYLINLDSRPDRLNDSIEECSKYNITFERFQACDGRVEIDNLMPSATGHDEVCWNKGAAGMCLSLIKLLEKCQKENADSVLIIEDDIEFNPEINNILDSVMRQVPQFWESLFFGLFEIESVRVSENVYLIKQGYNLHCHALKRDVFQYIIDVLSTLDDPADVKYSHFLFPRLKSFVIKPFLAWQRPSLSNIRGHYLDSKFTKPPEILTPKEITDICKKICILEDRISKYENETGSNATDYLSQKKLSELCYQTLILEIKLAKYEKYDNPLPLDSLSPAKIEEICTRVFLLEDKLSNLYEQLSKMEGQLGEFPIREAKRFQNFINAVIPLGTKRRCLARIIHNFLSKQLF